jgi:hypothetical protein
MESLASPRSSCSFGSALVAQSTARKCALPSAVSLPTPFLTFSPLPMSRSVVATCSTSSTTSCAVSSDRALSVTPRRLDSSAYDSSPTPSPQTWHPPPHALVLQCCRSARVALKHRHRCQRLIFDSTRSRLTRHVCPTWRGERRMCRRHLLHSTIFTIAPATPLLCSALVCSTILRGQLLRHLGVVAGRECVRMMWGAGSGAVAPPPSLYVR